MTRISSQIAKTVKADSGPMVDESEKNLIIKAVLCSTPTQSNVSLTAVVHDFIIELSLSERKLIMMQNIGQEQHNALTAAIKGVAEGHRTILEIDGVKFALVPVEDAEYIEDAQDLNDALKELENPGETIPMESVMKEYGLL
jgi:dihydroxyacetone kinase-like predicted kinase